VALDQALANLDLEIRESKAEITRDPWPTLPGDPVQLMQLFQNLVSNAIKYCRGRTPRIHIGAKREGAHHHVRVSDNGIGIPASQLREIFRIFQRVHGDESEFGGSGVGLAVCKRIVERHGGQLWCESVEG